jgi:hypothetical protein
MNKTSRLALKNQCMCTSPLFLFAPTGGNAPPDFSWVGYAVVAACMAGALWASRRNQQPLLYMFGGFGLLVSFFGLLAPPRTDATPPAPASDAATVLELQQCQAERDSLLDILQKSIARMERLANTQVKAQKVNKPASERRTSIQASALAQYKYVGKISDGLAPVKGKNGRWGYINRQNKEVVPCFLKMACTLHCGRGGVQHPEGLWGYVDPEGSVVIPYEFEEVLAFEPDKNAAMVLFQGMWMWIDLSGDYIREATPEEIKARNKV